MPSNQSGFPYCTKWKNYRYPLTRLAAEVGYSVDDTDEGAFAVAPIDIWISDDYFLMDLSNAYEVKMTSDTKDVCRSIKRPTLFVSGGSGQSETTAGGANPLFQLNVTDSINAIDVASSLANTLSRNGLAQSLYTIAPGLHFGFSTTSQTIYSTDDIFKWTMEASALNNLPKVMDGTYTCWYKLPVDAGSTVVTEPLPNGIANKSMNIMWNANRHIGKRNTTAANNGQSMILQGSIDGTTWIDIVKLIDDIDVTITMMTQVQWDSNALDGHDFPYKRLKFEYETGGSALDFHPHQFIQVNITPN